MDGIKMSHASGGGLTDSVGFGNGTENQGMENEDTKA